MFAADHIHSIASTPQTIAAQGRLATRESVSFGVSVADIVGCGVGCGVGLAGKPSRCPMGITPIARGSWTGEGIQEGSSSERTMH